MGKTNTQYDYSSLPENKKYSNQYLYQSKKHLAYGHAKLTPKCLVGSFFFSFSMSDMKANKSRI
jgi:hypothetical protein